ncbi:MAG TPA: GNAT family N-acetyltransferase [Lacibacter sp.]|nr:GNAT family N-acetyltransferase [Lacibacter sp.]HMO88341.1 GNAT family N-acetyltransferase [Lacibacter sp.]
MNVHLREWRTSDIPVLTQLANNPAVAAPLRDAFPHPYTEEHARTWVEFQQQQEVPHAFVIEVDGAFAGGTGLERRTDIYRGTVEIGYWLGEPFWGRGIASRAIGLLCDYIWHHLPDVHRIEALVFAHNTASQRVLAKNGFVQESYRRRAVTKDGQLFDDTVWVLLRENKD